MVDKKELIGKINGEFPGLKFSQIKLINCGFDHMVLLLDNKYIFRFPKDQHYKRKIKIEMSLLNKLKNKTDVAIPHYEFVPPDGSFGGYKVIPGKRLTKTVFNRLNEKSQKQLAKKLSDFLTALHTFPLATAKQAGLIQGWTIADRIKEFHKRKKYIYLPLASKEKNFVRNFIKKWAVLPVPKKLALIHFDLVGDHILIDGENLGGIIDFGDSALGDPANDFAWLWVYGKEFVHNVYNNYAGPKDKDFLLRSQYYYFATLLSSLYHGVVDNNKQQVTITLRTIRKIMEENEKSYPL